MNPPTVAYRKPIERYTRVGDSASVVGLGTYGSVFQAMDVLTQELVAIKTQRAESDDASREIALYAILRSFPHPNLVRMLDKFTVEKKDGRSELRLVMEYLPTSIAKILKTPEGRNGVMPRSRVAHYIRGIVCALDHMHNTIGIAHGDVTMNNILVGYDNTIKLGDFGTAHCAHTYICPEPLTTYYTRSPEQWADSQNVRPASDSWAVGVVSILLLTGECPFFAERDSA